MTEQVFKRVVICGDYEVSDSGQVRSNKFGTPKILKQSIRSKTAGYFAVSLQIGSLKKTFCVHRLVAEAFIPNPGNLPQVNHKNGNKLDNRTNNLEWVSCSQNVSHSVALGHNRNCGRQRRAVSASPGHGGNPLAFESVLSASKALGLDAGNIVLCCQGKRKKHGGYVWRYA